MPRRRWRWLKRGALGALVIVVALVSAAVIAVHTDWGRGRVRARVEQQLQSTFVGGATLGGVEGSPFSELTLRDLVINGPDGRPAISAKTVKVDVAILALLSRQARVLALRAEDLDVDLRRNASGELEIKYLTRPGPKSRWSIQLPKVEVRRAHVRIDTGSEVINLDTLDLDGRLKLPYNGPIDASVEARGTWRERDAAVLDVQTVVHSEGTMLRMPALAVKAGDVSVVASGVTVDSSQPGAPAIGGMVLVRATAAAVARLVPTLELPADIDLLINARPVAGQRWTELAVTGLIDQTPVRLIGSADLEARRARGELATGTLDLGKLSARKISGSAAGTVVFDVQPGGPRALPVATATIRGWGAVEGVPRTELDISVRSAGERVRATVDATGDRLRAHLSANLRMLGEQLTIEGATLRATADPARASGNKAPVRGSLRVDLAASGALRPKPSLAVTGTIDGRHLRMQDLSVRELHVAIDARRLPDRPLGTARVQLVDLVSGTMQLGELKIDATDRTDGKVAVAVRSRPKQNPWLLDADVLVTPPAQAGPSQVAIDIVRHRVRAGRGTDWTGRTGRVEIAPERIVVRDLTSASAAGRIALSAQYERAGRRRGDLVASIDARSLSLDDLGGTYHGTVDARASVSRRRGAWQGEVSLDGKGLSVEPSKIVVDGRARASLRGSQLEVTADASSLELGSVQLALDIDPPADVADPAGWKRLGRDAIRSGTLTLREIEVRRAAELAGLVGEYAGRIDGDIKISPDGVGGRIEARNVVAPSWQGVGPVSAVLDLSQTSPSELAPTLRISAEGVGQGSVQAQLEMPDRLFDPAAWTRLGRGALRGASVRAENIVVDPAMLDRFGVTSELRGRVSVAVDLGEAASTLQVKLDVAQLRGAGIVQPIDVHVEATSDRTTTTSLSVKANGAPLIALEGKLPLSLEQLLDRQSRDPEAIMATRLDATARLAAVDAPRLLAVFGRSEVIAGAIDGSVVLGGTLGKPTVKADLVATGLKVPPGPRGKPVRVVERLSVIGSWDGDTAVLAIDGVEAAGGKLQVAARARPSVLHEGTLRVTATKFDLVPILAFLPGPAGGAAGQLDANLTVTGLDPRTMRMAGELHLLEARLPIAPEVGTLRQAKIDAIILDNRIRLNLDGKLGAGTISVTGAVALDGAAPSSGNAKITLRKVSPIGVIEPQITADITATLSRDRQQWRADMVVDRARVVVPEDRGEKLKPVGAPTDMTFATGERITRRPMARETPTNPIVVATIQLRSTKVESEEFRGLVKGQLELRADGESVAVFGSIEADRGDLDLFGHRYYVERAGVHFDGPLDPVLDIRITHDFPEVTTATVIRGRASQPELTMYSDPGTYSQDQLLGFLLGGEPAGAPENSSATDKVTSAGASYLSNRLGGFVRDRLPLDIDVLRYEAATSSSSAAVTVGTWITSALFVAYRQHLEGRSDENMGEGEVEYWLSKRLVIEGVVGDRGFNGVDLLWRKRY
jgi:hypothetical protein